MEIQNRLEYDGVVVASYILTAFKQSKAPVPAKKQCYKATGFFSRRFLADSDTCKRRKQSVVDGVDRNSAKRQSQTNDSRVLVNGGRN